MPEFAARDIGKSVTTLKRWLSILGRSYVVFLLPPYYMNLGKRIIKSLKIYFLDTGLVSFLAGISTVEQWEKGIMYGPLFENYIVADVFKQILHNGLNYKLYFYRTSHGEEIDLIIDRGFVNDLVEIKASVIYRPGFQSVFSKINLPDTTRSVVYQGENLDKTDNVRALNYLTFLKDFIKNNAGNTVESFY
jgi:predicted AAA+ superfamily ATPase